MFSPLNHHEKYPISISIALLIIFKHACRVSALAACVCALCVCSADGDQRGCWFTWN